MYTEQFSLVSVFALLTYKCLHIAQEGSLFTVKHVLLDGGQLLQDILELDEDTQKSICLS